MPALFDLLRDFALAFEGAYEDHPFGEEVNVFKAANGKIAALKRVYGLELDVHATHQFHEDAQAFGAEEAEDEPYPPL